jgi:hypothetical protein
VCLALFIQHVKRMSRIMLPSVAPPVVPHFSIAIRYESNPGGGDIFRTLSDRPWGPPSLLYNGYRVSFPGVKRSGRGANHQPPSSAEVQERIEQYLYSLSGLSWPLLERTFTFIS